MRNSKLLTIGLSIILTATAIASGGNNSSNAQSYRGSSDSCESQPNWADEIRRSDVDIELYGKARFRYTDNLTYEGEEVPVVVLGDGGGMCYSPSSALRFPIPVLVLDNEGNVKSKGLIKSSGGQTNLETPKVIYVNHGWRAQTFFSISSTTTDFIATYTGNTEYVVYSNGRLYGTPRVNYDKISGIALETIDDTAYITKITREPLERGGREILETFGEQAKKIDISDIIYRLCKIFPKC